MLTSATVECMRSSMKLGGTETTSNVLREAYTEPMQSQTCYFA